MLNNHFDVLDRNVDNEFELKLARRTYILQVATEKEKKDWISILQRVKLQPEP
jgi:hypothetical protein